MEEELREYGLSEKEVKLYLANLKAGDSTANRLSELTGIRRTTVYEVIEALKKKGIISSYSKEKKLFFTAAKPETLISRLKEKEETIKRILPELNLLINAVSEKPEVQLFEGVTGIKNAIDDMLKSKEILVYGATNMGDSIFGAYIPNFAKKRAEKKIMLRAIIESNVPTHMTEKEVKKYTKIKTLDFLKDHKTAYFIYDDKLIITTLGEELRAMKLKSQVLIESQKIIFEFLWSIAK